MNRRATKNLQQSLVFPTSQVFLFRARRTEEIPTHDYQRHDRWMSPVSRVRLNGSFTLRSRALRIKDLTSFFLAYQILFHTSFVSFYLCLKLVHCIIVCCMFISTRVPFGVMINSAIGKLSTIFTRISESPVNLASSDFLTSYRRRFLTSYSHKRKIEVIAC